jgi:hypothetical protein
MRWVDFWDFVVIEEEGIETVERVNGGECFEMNPTEFRWRKTHQFFSFDSPRFSKKSLQTSASSISKSLELRPLFDSLTHFRPSAQSRFTSPSMTDVDKCAEISKQFSQFSSLFIFSI